MAYFRGSSRDLQSRAAQSASTENQIYTPLPILLSQDAKNPGQQRTELPPRYSQPRRLYDYSYVDPTEIWLIGQDFMVPGKQTYDLPPKAAARSRDYTHIDQAQLPDLVGTDFMVPGQQTYALPEPAPARARDYSLTDQAQIPQLVGQDFMVPGAQLTPPNPRGPQRCVEFPVGYNLTVWLDLANQTMPVGKSTFETDTPRGYARARDYTFLDQAQLPDLVGTDFVVPGEQTFDLPPRRAARAQDYTWVQSFELAVYQEIPEGQQSTALPPAPYARSRDYTFVDQAQLPDLVGTDFMVPGEQLSGNAPRGYARASDYTWLATGTPILDFQTSAVPPPGKSTDATALPPRQYARARDYSFTDWTFIGLIGTDFMVPGDQTYALPTPRAARAVDYTWLVTGVPILDFNVNANNIPPGEQSVDLPPKAQPRARDYTWINRLPNLIGQDAMAPGKSTDATALPPRGPQRARDYTWLQTYPLHIYEQLPVGDSTAQTELPPRAYQRMRDYTFLHLTDTQLIGQDFRVPGVQAFTNDLPPKAYARMRDYTTLLRVNLAELATETRLGKHTVTDHASFVHTLSDRPSFLHTVGDLPRLT